MMPELGREKLLSLTFEDDAERGLVLLPAIASSERHKFLAACRALAAKRHRISQNITPCPEEAIFIGSSEFHVRFRHRVKQLFAIYVGHFFEATLGVDLATGDIRIIDVEPNDEDPGSPPAASAPVRLIPKPTKAALICAHPPHSRSPRRRWAARQLIRSLGRGLLKLALDILAAETRSFERKDIRARRLFKMSVLKIDYASSRREHLHVICRSHPDARAQKQHRRDNFADAILSSASLNRDAIEYIENVDNKISNILSSFANDTYRKGSFSHRIVEPLRYRRPVIIFGTRESEVSRSDGYAVIEPKRDSDIRIFVKARSICNNKYDNSGFYLASALHYIRLASFDISNVEINCFSSSPFTYRYESNEMADVMRCMRETFSTFSLCTRDASNAGAHKTHGGMRVRLNRAACEVMADYYIAASQRYGAGETVDESFSMDELKIALRKSPEPTRIEVVWSP